MLTVVNDGAHGLYPKNVQVFAGDALQSGNLNAAPSGNKDAVTWLAWRTLDIWGGCSILAATGLVAVGIALSIDHSALADGNPGLSVKGATNTTAAIITAAGDADGLHVTASGAATQAILASGGGIGIRATGGASSAGALLTGGSSAVGAEGVPGSGKVTSFWAHTGFYFCDANVGGPATAIPGNSLAATNIPKAWGVGHCDGAGNIVQDGGVNWTAVIHSGGTQIDVTFPTAMSDANFAVSVTVTQGGGSMFVASQVGTPGASTFSFVACPITPGSPGSVGAACNFASGAYVFSFIVMGRQTTSTPG